MVKSCLGERLKRSTLVQILLNKDPPLVAGLSQTAFGGNRNPEESGGILCKYRNSGPTGIPVKNLVRAAENRNFQDPSKTTFL
jgi:hypothetical protein